MSGNKKTALKTDNRRFSIDVEKSSKSVTNSPVKPPRNLPRPPRLQIDQLSHVRVIQKELVYVIGLPPSVADEEVIARTEYFGQYGKVLKCMVNKGKAYTNSTCGVSYGAYITYSSEEEATLCIKAVNGFSLEGRVLTATFGTTKYCSNFLQGLECGKADCFYLHRHGSDADTLSRVNVTSTQHNKHIQPQDSKFNLIDVQIMPPDGVTRLLPYAQQAQNRRASESAYSPVRLTRHYSLDVSIPSRKNSRYNFVDDCTPETEEPVDLPELLNDMEIRKSLNQDITELPAGRFYAEKVKELLSPDSPYKFMPDVVDLIPKNDGFRSAPQSPLILFNTESYGTNGEEVYIISSKTTLL